MANREKLETMTNFILRGSKITANDECITSNWGGGSESGGHHLEPEKDSNRAEVRTQKEIKP